MMEDLNKGNDNNDERDEDDQKRRPSSSSKKKADKKRSIDDEDDDSGSENEQPSQSSSSRKRKRNSGEKTNHERRWEQMYQRLKRYKEVNGDANVPNRYEADPQLGSWVSAQRRAYKMILSGATGSSAMTLERATKLKDLGFEWEATNPKNVPWDVRYQELVGFVKKYGHANVPMRWKENVQLSNWVNKQRHDYKLALRGTSKRLTDTRKKKLNDLNFIWEVDRGCAQAQLQRMSVVGLPKRKSSYARLDATALLNLRKNQASKSGGSSTRTSSSLDPRTSSSLDQRHQRHQQAEQASAGGYASAVAALSVPASSFPARAVDAPATGGSPHVWSASGGTPTPGSGTTTTPTPGSGTTTTMPTTTQTASSAPVAEISSITSSTNNGGASPWDLLSQSLNPAQVSQARENVSQGQQQNDADSSAANPQMYVLPILAFLPPRGAAPGSESAYLTALQSAASAGLASALGGNTGQTSSNNNLLAGVQGGGGLGGAQPNSQSQHLDVQNLLSLVSQHQRHPQQPPMPQHPLPQHPLPQQPAQQPNSIQALFSALSGTRAQSSNQSQNNPQMNIRNLNAAAPQPHQLDASTLAGLLRGQASNIASANISSNAWRGPSSIPVNPPPMDAPGVLASALTQFFAGSHVSSPIAASNRPDAQPASPTGRAAQPPGVKDEDSLSP